MQDRLESSQNGFVSNLATRVMQLSSFFVSGPAGVGLQVTDSATRQRRRRRLSPALICPSRGGGGGTSLGHSCHSRTTSHQRDVDLVGPRSAQTYALLTNQYCPACLLRRRPPRRCNLRCSTNPTRLVFRVAKKNWIVSIILLFSPLAVGPSREFSLFNLLHLVGLNNCTFAKS